LGRVGEGTQADTDFLCWAEEEFPAFNAHVSPRFNWMNARESNAFEVPDIGCAQWFQLHILANGRDAFCYTDPDGNNGIGNAAIKHVVDDIYNAPERRALRAKLPSRLLVEKCAGCTALA